MNTKTLFEHLLSTVADSDEEKENDDNHHDYHHDKENKENKKYKKNEDKINDKNDNFSYDEELGEYHALNDDDNNTLHDLHKRKKNDKTVYMNLYQSLYNNVSSTFILSTLMSLIIPTDLFDNYNKFFLFILLMVNSNISARNMLNMKSYTKYLKTFNILSVSYLFTYFINYFPIFNLFMMFCISCLIMLGAVFISLSKNIDCTYSICSYYYKELNILIIPYVLSMVFSKQFDLYSWIYIVFDSVSLFIIILVSSSLLFLINDIINVKKNDADLNSLHMYILFSSVMLLLCNIFA